MRLLNLIRHYMGRHEFRASAANTRRNMVTCAAKLSPLADMEVAEITRSDLTKISDQLSAGAAHAFLSNATTLFNWALDEGVIERNPLSRVRKPRLGRRRAWTEAERLLMQESASTPVRLAVTLAYYTGQRIGDVLAMKWEHTDSIDRPSLIKVVQEKTGHRLIVPLSSNVVRTMINIAPRFSYMVHNQGKMVTYDQLVKAFVADRRRLGLPEDLKLHGLRKTMAVAATQGGATEMEVMAMGGWTDPKTMHEYAFDASQFKLASVAASKL